MEQDNSKQIRAYYIVNGGRSQRVTYEVTTSDLYAERKKLREKHKGKDIFFEYSCK